MNKTEREWVAMMVAELHSIGLREVSAHYLDVFVRLDPCLRDEYQKCLIIFKKERKRQDETD